jgi:hypothetical protein
MPDTVPGISFNQKHECNYCQEKYPYYSPSGEEALTEKLQEHIRKDSPADCLVGLSGGKDSTYSLISLQEKFNMRVEAFTYVHEGSTAFSIENAKNTCKKLNIKHHIVSLDNQEHQKTFSGFFEAWVKAPSPTTAGMTCVACKHLHLFGLKLARERKIPMIVWSSSPFEYSPFLALKLDGDKNNQLKREGNAKGALLLLAELIKTKEFPLTFLKHFNTCFNGCRAAFPTSGFLASKYPEITPVFFYEYLFWNPKEIKEFIKSRVDWKIPDEKEDWHSDCLFNYFKEYMFLSMYGASYTDSFLSNQIRYGLLTREEALADLEKSRISNSEGIIKALEKLNLHHLINKIDKSLFTNNIL